MLHLCILYELHITMNVIPSICTYYMSYTILVLRVFVKICETLYFD